VKPVAEDASLGISNDSMVRDIKSLQERVTYVIERYNQSALVEEFITGREINAAAWGDPLELLPLSEIDFNDFAQPEAGIVNYAAKWQAESFEFHHTPAICPANLKPNLEKKIRRSVITALQCSGVNNYTRVDLRIAENDTPYILEINANPDISPGAGFFRAVEQSGLTYPDLVLKILTNARRHSDDYRSFRRPR
jgi:D-alanine-D-alanine ligase